MTTLTPEAQRTLAAFFAHAAQSDARLELLEGETLTMPSPTPLHQQVLRAILRYLEAHVTTGVLYFAPMDVELDAQNVFQPDLLWLAPQSACRVGDTRLHGAPDLVVEVTSRGTKLRDKRDKFRVYERVGVREYWLVDPDEAFLEVWQQRDGAFHFIGAFGAGDVFTSHVLAQDIAVQPLLQLPQAHQPTSTETQHHDSTNQQA